MDTLYDLPIFAGVVEHQSFTAAAKHLKMSKSHVSKTIRQLEERLGVRLFDRTTRTVTVTEAGSALYERARRILADLAEAEAEVTNLQSTVTGTLRVSLPMSLGVAHLNPIVAEFARQHPKLTLAVDLSDRRVDLLGEGFDVAVRVGRLPDSSLIAKRIAPTRSYVVGSDAYFAEHGTPEHPNDLEHHSCMVYDYADTGSTWDFARYEAGRDPTQATARTLGEPVERVQVRVSGSLATNNGELLREFAETGRGLAVLPDFLSAESLRSGRLRAVLLDWTDARAAVYAVYPHRRLSPLRLRVFVDHLSSALQPAPPWCVDVRALAGNDASAEGAGDE